MRVQPSPAGRSPPKSPNGLGTKQEARQLHPIALEFGLPGEGANGAVHIKRPDPTPVCDSAGSVCMTSG
jgi:hypothetical protein